MDNHEQAFWNGFVKRAAEYGISEDQLLKAGGLPGLLKGLGKIVHTANPAVFGPLRSEAAQAIRGARNQMRTTGKYSPAKLNPPLERYRNYMAQNVPHLDPTRSRAQGIPFQSDLANQAGLNLINDIQQGGIR